jgi:hypothetical protein
MQKTILILSGLAVLAWAAMQSPDKTRHAWFWNLTGWQKMFGLVAVVLALLIVLNPEFLALGLLGDTAFFDMLVLALSLQMHAMVVRTFRRCVTALSRTAKWLGAPNLRPSYSLAVVVFTVGSVVSAVQKAVHRIVS